MIHFIRPYYLLFLIPAIFYLLWYVFSRHSHNPWKDVCDAHLMPALMQTGSLAKQRLLTVNLFIFYVLSILALAGPALTKASFPVFRQFGSLMLVLDLSPEMEAMDIKPNRLMRAKFIIRDMISAAENTQMGLVVFTREAFTVSPLSQDANTLGALIDELDPSIMPVDGSDSGQGILTGYQLLNQAQASQGNLLLMTASEPTKTTWAAAKQVAEGGGHLHVYAMLADTAENQVKIANLQQLAKAGNGSFYIFKPDSADIQTILKEVADNKIVRSENLESASLWLDAGPWICLALIPCLLVALRGQHEKV